MVLVILYLPSSIIFQNVQLLVLKTEKRGNIFNEIGIMTPEESEIINRASVVMVTSPDRYRYGFKEDYEERMWNWQEQNKSIRKLNKSREC